METIANKDSVAKKKLTKLIFFIILLSIQSDIFTCLLEKNKQTNKQTNEKQNKTKPKNTVKAQGVS